MLANSYTGMVESNVTRLIVSRARRLHLSGDEIDDLQQQIVPKVARFQFDAQRSNGASHTTALTSVIDRQVKTYLRTRRRYRRRIQLLSAEPGRYATRLMGCHEAAPPEPVDLRLDLEAAMARLSQRDREICRLLSEGWAVLPIAKRLHCGRDTIGRAIARIRQTFIAAGLRAWVDPNDGQA